MWKKKLKIDLKWKVKFSEEIKEKNKKKLSSCESGNNLVNTVKYQVNNKKMAAERSNSTECVKRMV